MPCAAAPPREVCYQESRCRGRLPKRARSCGPVEIRLVDFAPAALRRRLSPGLVFGQQQADAALSSYFRLANLAALRELAKSWLDDTGRGPAELLVARGISEPGTAVVIMVGLAGTPADARGGREGYPAASAADQHHRCWSMAIRSAT